MLFSQQPPLPTRNKVDNETTDWKYLLALKALALECGMYPAAFTKTGWPQPGPGCPKDLALIPYFGVRAVFYVAA